jgi:hypothetical protein
MELGLAQRIFAYNLGRFIIEAYKAGYEFSMGEVLRTEEQHQLNLKSGKSRIGRSIYMDKLAFDLNLMKTPTSKYGYITDSAQYKPLGDIWKSLHPLNRWGGDFKRLDDPFHYEMNIR